jgi:hypothetical protein
MFYFRLILLKQKNSILEKSQRYKMPFYYADTEIEISFSYSYLGIPFGKPCKFRTIACNNIAEANTGCGRVKQLVRKAKPDSWQPLNNLFYTIASATLFYARRF